MAARASPTCCIAPRRSHREVCEHLSSSPAVQAGAWCDSARKTAALKGKNTQPVFREMAGKERKSSKDKGKEEVKDVTDDCTYKGEENHGSSV